LLDHGLRGSEPGERAEILAQRAKDLGQPEAQAGAATHLFPRHQEARPQHQPLLGLGERRRRCPPHRTATQVPGGSLDDEGRSVRPGGQPAGLRAWLNKRPSLMNSAKSSSVFRSNAQELLTR